jgi:hypothetical protein
MGRPLRHQVVVKISGARRPRLPVLPGWGVTVSPTEDLLPGARVPADALVGR